MDEIHCSICGLHFGKHTMASHLVRVGHYWPTIQHDCKQYVHNYKECQAHGPVDHSTVKELQSITSLYRLPYLVVVNNGTQFVSNSLHKFYEGLGINHKSSLVEQPESN
ncbi:hypothetical protein CR513_50899, partial [Mucuna pruriens]